MIIFKHLFYSLKYGEWDIGFESRKTWKEKPYWGLCYAYYDGHMWCLHFGYFYIGASYY